MTGFGNRILILVPHPDDEVVACCTAIRRAQKLGAQIYALYLTDGCVDRETLWPWQRKSHLRFVAQRRREAERVARILGITTIGWSKRSARHLWRDLEEIRREVSRAIDEFAIDQLWVPAYEGGNPDHDGLNALAQVYAHPGEHVYEHEVKTTDSRPPLSVLEFAEYNFSGGRTCSQTFPVLNGTETVLKLAPDEQKFKKETLAVYASERSNLNYVDTVEECYRPLATTYDYRKPAHSGVLWYARFQWVPFRHPRVDFTKARDVSKAIIAFFDAIATAPPGSATQRDPGQKSARHDTFG